jgi:hypothetical protein
MDPAGERLTMPELLQALGPVARIAASPVFRGVDPEAVCALLAESMRSVYGAGEVVREAHAGARVLHVVEAGLVFVLPAAPGGRGGATVAAPEPRSRVTMHCVEAGGVFGEHCFLVGEPFRAKAVAALPSIVLAVDHEIVTRLSRRWAGLARLSVNLLRILVPAVAASGAA